MHIHLQCEKRLLFDLVQLGGRNFVMKIETFCCGVDVFLKMGEDVHFCLDTCQYVKANTADGDRIGQDVFHKLTLECCDGSLHC